MSFYQFMRPAAKILFKLFYHPTYKGVDYLPKQGAFVLAGNHTNYLDCLFLISSTKRQIHFLAKEELVKGHGGFFFKKMGVIPVNRKLHDKNALSLAIQTLKQQKVIGIFPEGTINRSNDITLPFKIGAVKMSKEANCPIIPFVVTGKYQLFRKKIHIQFLPPFWVKNNLSLENEELRNQIESYLGKERNI